MPDLQGRRTAESRAAINYGCLPFRSMLEFAIFPHRKLTLMSALGRPGVPYPFQRLQSTHQWSSAVCNKWNARVRVSLRSYCSTAQPLKKNATEETDIRPCMSYQARIHCVLSFLHDQLQANKPECLDSLDSTPAFVRRVAVSPETTSQKSQPPNPIDYIQTPSSFPDSQRSASRSCCFQSNPFLSKVSRQLHV
jgi:hypothetical protein